MKDVLAPEVQEILDVPRYLPSVTVIVPFEPKMNSKNTVQKQLHSAYSSVKHQLFTSHAKETAEAVLNRLNKMMEELDYTTHKKSICIFVSPLTQKVIYLSIPVQPRVVIDESFRVRDIVFSKKQYQRFLLLLFGGNSCRLYLCDADKLIKVICDIPGDISTDENDIPERVANFSDPSARKENVLHKFLRSVNNSLKLMLEAYPLPIIMMGTERLLGHFKKISHRTEHVVAFVHGNFMTSSATELLEQVRPYIGDWGQLKEKGLLMQIDKANSSGSLVTGIERVYSTASRVNNKLLIVEQDYEFPADKLPGGAIQPNQNESVLHINDAVDDVIENVLRSGGDVEFVRNGVLKDFDRIALIKYYGQETQYNYS